ncbi:hypothetical protein ACERK3_09545 [Phycisphaerales bacterium AB-hyl4]|uniref:Uncharacterized protein n=1 Tax=Natronomicrosphaera hydrolytica TaxID=3242702 RepID=A0ABV4U7P9_9BACT
MAEVEPILVIQVIPTETGRRTGFACRAKCTPREMGRIYGELHANLLSIVRGAAEHLSPQHQAEFSRGLLEGKGSMVRTVAEQHNVRPVRETGAGEP